MASHSHTLPFRCDKFSFDIKPNRPSFNPRWQTLMNAHPGLRSIATSSLLLLGMTTHVAAQFPWLIFHPNAPLVVSERLVDPGKHFSDPVKAIPLQDINRNGIPRNLAMTPITNSHFGVSPTNLQLHQQSLVLGPSHSDVYLESQWVDERPHVRDQSRQSQPGEITATWKPETLSEISNQRITNGIRWQNQLRGAVSKLLCGAENAKDSGTSDTQMNVPLDKFNTSRLGEAIFDSPSHYLTVAFPSDSDAEAVNQTSKKPAPHASIPIVKVKPTDLPTLPVEVTSFGGAVANKTLFIYGGHIGSAHSYSTAEQSDEFWSLDLKEPNKWRSRPSGPRLQGLVMVPHQDSVIRIGGFTARNAEGEKHDLHSQAGVSRFDLKNDRWVDLDSLPEPRSSLGATVIGDDIYVIGGWALKGEETDWHRTAWKLDAGDPSAKWQAIAEPPFQRRALFVASHNGLVYVIGGMGQEGPTTRTDVYDPKKDSWTRGPDLVGEPMTGFGCASQSLGKELYVSTISGNIQCLGKDNKSWEVVEKYDPARFFHVMVPWTDHAMLLVGGANMSVGKFTELDAVVVESPR